MKLNFNNQSGIAFIMVIILLAVIGSLASALLLMYSSNINIANKASARNQAFYAAEGGANYLDLKLNNFYQDNIAGKSFFKAEKIKEQLDILNADIQNDNIKIDDFNISISYSPDSNYKDNNIYKYEITADNGKLNETISVNYKVAHLIDYFKYSRFGNKINIENSYFNDVDDHAFGTDEMLYSQWSEYDYYNKSDFVVNNNDLYVSKDDYSPGKAIEPGEDGWEEDWEINRDIVSWDSNKTYKYRKKVIFNNDIYTSLTKDNNSSPDTNDWEINDPDLAKQGFADSKVDYNQIALPNPEDYDYEKKIVEEFKKRLETENGVTYEDDAGSYPTWNDISYSTGDQVVNNSKVYKCIRRNGYYSGWGPWRKWNDTPQPEPGVEEDWGDYWVELNAGQDFLDNYSKWNDANYILIDGDLTSTTGGVVNFEKENDEVVHILVDGEISPQANISFRGDANIIIYTTADIVSYQNGHITMPSNSNINLAYFAPFATITSNGFRGGYASSMVFNQINLKNQRISSVKTYSDDNPLRGSIDPGIAELTRAYGDPDYDIDKAGPLRLDWKVK
jgi:Tfp pilus assembly protein PilX